MPTIRGREFQHGTISLQAANGAGSFKFRNFTAINYKTGAKKKPVHRSSGEQFAYTIDNEDTSGPSITTLLSEWIRFKAELKAEFPDLGPGQVEMDWTVTYGHDLANLITDKLIGVLFEEEPRDSSNNQDALMVKLPLFITKVKPHGGDFIVYPEE